MSFEKRVTLVHLLCLKNCLTSWIDVSISIRKRGDMIAVMRTCK